MNARAVQAIPSPVGALDRATRACHAAIAAGRGPRVIRRKRLRMLYAALREVAPPYREGIATAARLCRGGAK